MGSVPRGTRSCVRWKATSGEWTPGREPESDPRLRAIATASRELVAKRDEWLRGADGKKRSLTRLYNARPAWLDTAHRKLDAAVFAAYGWDPGINDEELLSRLLELNRERSATATKSTTEAT